MDGFGKFVAPASGRGQRASDDVTADDPGLVSGTAMLLQFPGHDPANPPEQHPAEQAAPARPETLDLAQSPPDPDLRGLLSPETAIALSAVPYAEIGTRLVVVTARAELSEEIARAFPDREVLIALASEHQLNLAIGDLYGHHLARVAACRAPYETSARIWGEGTLGRRIAPVLALLLVSLIALPGPTIAMLTLLSIAVFAINMILKLAAATATYRAQTAASISPKAVPLFPEPTITLLLPLFDENDVAGDILARVDRLEYPRDRLDVIFVLEDGDETTRDALRACELPHWARAITVPAGDPQTKPRALNYALPFSRGTIIGIYDAEDAPEPDQLKKIAARFAEAPPQVACLQGQLDYYNSGHNWLSRCFTVEYAAWFRLLLPGVARLGLVVPLGGTTLFVKRDALIRVGAWDAHNVTEDAELGIRLNRAGFRTELIDTTTFEEANSAIWPWVRQRTRWLKGYAITWATLMRHPRALYRDLGPKRFIGMQIQLAGTILGFVAAPMLWSLALIPLGQPHPAAAWMTPEAVTGITAVFAFALLATLWINWLACAAPHLRRHRVFLPVMLVYYPLASVAAVLALVDLAARPFYWAKTAHGRYVSDDSAIVAASSVRRTSKALLK